MRFTDQLFAFVLTIVVSSITALSAPAPLPDLSTFPAGLGVNIHFTDPKPGELEQIYAAGFRWVRMDLGWGGIERKKGEYDFSAYDRLVTALDAHHIKAYFILDYSNRNYDNDLSPSSDEGRAAFAKWAAASVRHFKDHGIIWEMYNEPNIGFWRPTPSVDDYAKLALTVGKALREAEPGEIYIGPATSTIDLPFLETCFKAGCLEYWSAVSVHPYRQKDPETVADEYRALRRLIAKYAPKDRRIPIISGEWGYSSVWNGFDEDRQAKYLPREVLTNIANDVPLSIWYDWHEDGKDPKEGEHHFGIVRPDEVNKGGNLYEPKPAYLAAKEMTDKLAGFHFDKQLFFSSDEEKQILMFQNDKGKIALVYWTTGKPGKLPRQPYWRSAELEQLSLTQTPQYDIIEKPSAPMQALATWSRTPLDLVVQGPTTVRIETSIRNPFTDRVMRVGHSHFDEGITLEAAQQRGYVSEIPVGCPSDVFHAPVRICISTTGSEAMNLEVWQTTFIAVTNPLSAELFPPTATGQQARVENPSGVRLRGKATLTTPRGDPIASVDFGFKRGQRENVIAIDAKSDHPNEELRGFKLVDNGGAVMLDIRAARYVPLAGFANGNPSKNWQLVADGDAKVTSEQTLTEAAPPDGPPVPGLAAVKIAYRFDKGWKFIRLIPRDPKDAAVEGQPRTVRTPAITLGGQVVNNDIPEIIQEQPHTLGLWLYGDGQGNVARMRFTDKSGQTFQPDAGRITWTGWRYVTFPLDGVDTAHWGGKDDGNVQFPIRIDSLFLLDSHNREATHGEIYLSTPTLVYDE